MKYKIWQLKYNGKPCCDYIVTQTDNIVLARSWTDDDVIDSNLIGKWISWTSDINTLSGVNDNAISWCNHHVDINYTLDTIGHITEGDLFLLLL